MSVSVAMIVKNEEQTLPRCLDSIAGAVDEIVIVDTGSADATREVARRYTDRVFDLAWPDSFAAARQFAFDRASSEWICWLDADDVVHGAEKIRDLTASASASVGGFCWRYVYGRDRWGGARCELWRERCVRHDGSFRWTGRVHEVLVTDRPWQLVRASEVVVEHQSPPERNATRGPRNLELLERELAESGEGSSARLLFYLGREHASAGHLERALDYLGQCVERSTWDDERYLAQVQVADLHRQQGDFDRALDADLRALKTCPHWPYAYFSLAQTYYYQRDWHKVVHWCEVGRAMPEPDSILLMDPAAYRYGWIIYFTNALYHIGALDEARAWTRRALEHCPDDEQHLANLQFFAGASPGLLGTSVQAVTV
jgi:tetratricopeptide (TPR) repeat protein